MYNPSVTSKEEGKSSPFFFETDLPRRSENDNIASISINAIGFCCFSRSVNHNVVFFYYSKHFFLQCQRIYGLYK